MNLSRQNVNSKQSFTRTGSILVVLEIIVCPPRSGRSGRQIDKKSATETETIPNQVHE